MSKNILVGALALVVGVVLGAVFGGSSNQNIGGAVNISEQRFVQGIKVGTTDQFSVSNAGVVSTGDITVAGGDVDLTPKASLGTTTLTVGCIDGLYPTSTLTVARILFGIVATTTGNGFVLWQYGSCP
jgi:hypothetical protein